MSVRNYETVCVYINLRIMKEHEGVLGPLVEGPRVVQQPHRHVVVGQRPVVLTLNLDR